MPYKNKDFLYEEYITFNKSAKQIAEELKIHSCTVFRWLQRHDIPRKFLCNLKGELNPNWKGGKSYKHGYLRVMDRENHRADRHGYVNIHTLIAEEKLGRRLKDKEIVHHIDGNKKNNNPDNLYIYKNRQKHLENHRSLEKLALELYKLNIIEFNNKTGKYKINHESI